MVGDGVRISVLVKVDAVEKCLFANRLVAMRRINYLMIHTLKKFSVCLGEVRLLKNAANWSIDVLIQYIYHRLEGGKLRVSATFDLP